jgi:hypothetical protein
MRALSIGRISGAFALAFALTALLTVMTGYFQAPQAPPTDEGTGAHIFQLSLVLFAPSLLLFIATADWRSPRSSAALLAVCLVAVAASFVALFLGEHVFWYR